MRPALPLALLLAAAAPLSDAARQQLAETERAARQARDGSVLAAAGSAEARRRAEAARAQLPKLAAQVARSERRLAAAQRALADVEAAQTRRRGAIAERQAGATELVAVLQTMARRPSALALVQPGGASDIAHARMALDAMLPAVQSRTAALRAEAAAAEPARRRLVAARDEEAQLALALARDQVALERAEREARLRSAALATRSVEERNAAVRHTAEAASLRELVERLAPSSGAAPAALRLRVPTRGQALLAATDPLLPFSLDFAAPPGSPVIAPAAGRVAFADAFRSYGGVVIVDHGGGWRSILSGLGGVSVTGGAIVAGGAAIGRAGGVPVRYELRRGTAALDPRPWLPQGFAVACRDDASFAHGKGRAMERTSKGEIPCRVRS